MIRLGYCLGVKSVVSIKETIMYQLEAGKKNPKSSQSLQGRATNRFFVLSLDLSYHLVFRAFDLATPSISATTTINPTQLPPLNPIQHHVQIASTTVRPWQPPRSPTNSASLPLMGVLIPCSGCTVATCAWTHGRQ